MDCLTVWTIYDHPRDFPNHFVARKFQDQYATQHVFYAHDLEAVRQFVRDDLAKLGIGAECLERSMYDDPVILETWF